MTTITMTDISALSPDHPDGILRILESMKPKSDKDLKSLIKAFRAICDPYIEGCTTIDNDEQYSIKETDDEEEKEKDKQEKDHMKNLAIDKLNTATWGNGLVIEFEPLSEGKYIFQTERDYAILKMHGII